MEKKQCHNLNQFGYFEKFGSNQIRNLLSYIRTGHSSFQRYGLTKDANTSAMRVEYIVKKRINLFSNCYMRIRMV